MTIEEKKKLAKELYKNGMYQYVIAERLGVSQGTICAWVNDKKYHKTRNKNVEKTNGNEPQNKGKYRNGWVRLGNGNMNGFRLLCVVDKKNLTQTVITGAPKLSGTNVMIGDTKIPTERYEIWEKNIGEFPYDIIKIETYRQHMRRAESLRKEMGI